MSLHNFFKMAKPTEGKKNFIYDCASANTWFTDELSPNDEFVVGKCGIRLWKRNVHHHSPAMTYTSPLNPCPVPLLKSHLQKAIRRKKTELALQTLYSLMQQDTTATLRRLPILAIEDVCVIQGLSTIVWLMMADKKHTVTEMDYAFLENFVYSLCETDEYFECTGEENDTAIKIERALSHKNIVDADPENIDDILALLYRIEYGGMKCDKRLFQNAIIQHVSLYVDTPKAIGMTTSRIDKNASRVHIKLSLNPDEFIQEAIDFHPYPWIVKKIYSTINVGVKDKISCDVIKLYIWQVESSLNIRKNWSVARSQHVAKDNLWKHIALELRGMRSYIVHL
jgi:hypothetical protein